MCDIAVRKFAWQVIFHAPSRAFDIEHENISELREVLFADRHRIR